MFHLNKGHYGYLDRRKKRLLFEVGLVAVGIVILLVLGYVSTKTRKNLLTVVAAVSVIPLANQLVILFAIVKYHSRPKEEYDQVAALVGNGLLNTELIITSRTEKSMEINYAYIHEKGVFCYSADKSLDARHVEEYIKGYLDTNEVPADVFVIRDWKNYLNRLSELPEEDRKTCDERLLKIEGVIRAIAV